MHQIFPVSKYGKTHPEYYPLIKNRRFVPSGKHDSFRPCVSNPEVVAVAVDYLRKYFDSHPGSHSFSFAMNDVTRHCHCENCVALDRDPQAIKRDDLSDRTSFFVNAVAKELAKTHPDRYLGLLFYRHTYQPPDKVEKLESNVFGYITSEASSWWGKDGAKLENADQGNTDIWAGISTLPLSRYEYLGLGTYTPVFYPHAMDRQMKRDHQLGMEGGYTEFYTMLPNTLPMVWAFYRLQWDADLSMGDLLDEFYEKMFRNAAGEMSAYYTFLEDVWKKDRPGRKGGFLSLSRNVREQSLVFSPVEIALALGKLDQALAAAKEEIVRTRIGIIRDSLEFASHGVMSYSLAEVMRKSKINNGEEALAMTQLITDYSEGIKIRNYSWETAASSRNILGESIRMLKSHRYLMADELAFNRIDKHSLLPAILNLQDWYTENTADRLPELMNTLAAMELPGKLAFSIQAYQKAGAQANLLPNSGFEERGKVPAPKGWSTWIRPSWKYQLTPSSTSTRKAAGRQSSRAAVLSAGTGGTYLYSLPVKPGAKYLGSVWIRSDKSEAAAKAHLTLKFKDAKGSFLNRGAGKRLMYEHVYGIESTDWQRLAVDVTAPRSARSLSVMLGHERAGADVLFDDVLLLQTKSAPASLDFATKSDLPSLFAEGVFRKKTKGQLSSLNVQKDAEKTLVFSAGESGDHSFVRIAGLGHEFDFTKAMTISARIKVDVSAAKGTMEISENSETDQGKGFRFYLKDGILHFVSGSGLPRKTARIWGVKSDKKQAIKAGNWYHVAARYDGSVFQIYINGELSGSSKPGLKMTKGEPDICIGSYHDGTVFGFSGKITELDMIDQALSQRDIKELAASVVSPTK